MVDPLSTISGIAGIATAGAALASILYDIIHTIRDAPREMIDIARGIRELSSCLRELRRTLKQGTELFRRSLFKSLRSAVHRIKDVHQEIDGLLALDGGHLARLKWVFRKSKATNLLAKIESHKSTISLFLSTLLLAIGQRKHTLTKNEDAEDERRTLRREAETLVRATERDIHRLLPQKISEDAGTQTEESMSAPPEEGLSSEERSDNFSPNTNNQIEKWDNSLDDTARWLYHLVFLSDNDLERQQMPNLSAADMLIISGRAPKRVVVDRLLLHWTTLNSNEVRTTRISKAAPSPWESRLTEHANLAGLDEAEDESSEEELVIWPESPDKPLRGEIVVEEEASSDDYTARETTNKTFSEDESIENNPVYTDKGPYVEGDSVRKESRAYRATPPRDSRASSTPESPQRLWTSHRNDTYYQGRDAQRAEDRDRPQSIETSPTRRHVRRRSSQPSHTKPPKLSTSTGEDDRRRKYPSRRDIIVNGTAISSNASKPVDPVSEAIHELGSESVDTKSDAGAVRVSDGHGARKTDTAQVRRSSEVNRPRATRDYGADEKVFRRKRRTPIADIQDGKEPATQPEDTTDQRVSAKSKEQRQPESLLRSFLGRTGVDLLTPKNAGAEKATASQEKAGPKDARDPNASTGHQVKSPRVDDKVTRKEIPGARRVLADDVTYSDVTAGGDRTRVSTPDRQYRRRSSAAVRDMNAQATEPDPKIRRRVISDELRVTRRRDSFSPPPDSGPSRRRTIERPPRESLSDLTDTTPRPRRVVSDAPYRREAERGYRRPTVEDDSEEEVLPSHTGGVRRPAYPPALRRSATFEPRTTEPREECISPERRHYSRRRRSRLVDVEEEPPPDLPPRPTESNDENSDAPETKSLPEIPPGYSAFSAPSSVGSDTPRNAKPRSKTAPKGKVTARQEKAKAAVPLTKASIPVSEWRRPAVEDWLDNTSGPGEGEVLSQ